MPNRLNQDFLLSYNEEIISYFWSQTKKMQGSKATFPQNLLRRHGDRKLSSEVSET